MTGLSAFGTATIHESLGRRGALDPAIKPVAPGMRLCGPALTVACAPGDNLALHRAIAVARPGEVLVVSMGGHHDYGPFGDVMAEAARLRGIAGLVIDGSVRDGATISEMGFAVFARGLCIRGTVKLDPGAVGDPVLCGGVLVATGDIVVGDGDGVVAVPAGEVDETLRRAAAREAHEDEVRDRLRRGETTLDIMGLAARLPRRDD